MKNTKLSTCLYFIIGCNTELCYNEDKEIDKLENSILNPSSTLTAIVDGIREKMTKTRLEKMSFEETCCLCKKKIIYQACLKVKNNIYTCYNCEKKKYKNDKDLSYTYEVIKFNELFQNIKYHHAIVKNPIQILFMYLSPLYISSNSGLRKNQESDLFSEYLKILSIVYINSRLKAKFSYHDFIPKCVIEKLNLFSTANLIYISNKLENDELLKFLKLLLFIIRLDILMHFTKEGEGLIEEIKDYNKAIFDDSLLLSKSSIGSKNIYNSIYNNSVLKNIEQYSWLFNLENCSIACFIKIKCFFDSMIENDYKVASKDLNFKKILIEKIMDTWSIKCKENLPQSIFFEILEKNTSPYFNKSFFYENNTNSCNTSIIAKKRTFITLTTSKSRKNDRERIPTLNDSKKYIDNTSYKDSSINFDKLFQSKISTVNNETERSGFISLNNSLKEIHGGYNIINRKRFFNNTLCTATVSISLANQSESKNAKNELSNEHCDLSVFYKSHIKSEKEKKESNSNFSYLSNFYKSDIKNSNSKEQATQTAGSIKKKL